MSDMSESIIDHVNSIVMVLQSDGTIAAMNSHAEKFFGEDRAGYVGSNIADYADNDKKLCGPQIKAIFETISSLTEKQGLYYGALESADRKTIWVVWTYSTEGEGTGEKTILVGNEVANYKLLENDRRHTNERFKVMLENIQTGVIIIDPIEGVILYVNNVGADIFGLPRDRIVGEKYRNFCNPDDNGCVAVQSLEGKEFIRNIETTMVKGDGQQIYLLKNTTMVNFNGSEFILESFADISEKKNTEEQLLTASRQIENLLSSIVSVLIGVSIHDYVTHWNKVAENLFGIDEADVLNKRFPGCGIDWEWDRIYEGIADSILPKQVTYLENVEFKSRSGSKGYLDVTINVILDKNSQITGFLLFGEDVTEKRINKQLVEEIEHRKKIEQELTRLNGELERLAKQDPLTGIANRRCFMEEFEAEFLRSRRYGTALGMMIMDIDHFKKINDTYGHLVGDRVLIEVAQTVSRIIRSSDRAGRYGGEEFCVLLPMTGGNDDIVVAEKLRMTISEIPFEENGVNFQVTCSVGVAIMNAGDSDTTDIIRRADAALYTAKESGRNRVILGP